MTFAGVQLELSTACSSARMHLRVEDHRQSSSLRGTFSVKLVNTSSTYTATVTLVSNKHNAAHQESAGPHSAGKRQRLKQQAQSMQPSA